MHSRVLLPDWIKTLKPPRKLTGWLYRCAFCGRDFVTNRSQSRYCSRTCKEEFYRAYQRNYMREYRSIMTDAERKKYDP